jgi:hypothetical protein
MVASKFYLKYHLIGIDRNGEPIEGKFKTIEQLIDEVGDKCDIYNRGTVYKIINNFLKSDKYSQIKILKIKEALPFRYITKKVLIGETDSVAPSIGAL